MGDDDLELGGAVAVVTGAGRGLGRHFATWLAEWGASVVAVGRSTSSVDETVERITGSGGTARSVHADVTEPGSAGRVIAEADERFGPVTHLVNNAGTMHLGRIDRIDPGAWWTDFEVNVRAPMQWCQAAVAAMAPRGEGTIVNIGSTATQWVVPAGSAYIASKAAVMAFTRVLAAEMAGSGVKVFAFGPWARTDMTDGLGTSPAFTADQRAAFGSIDDTEAARRLAGTRRMFRQILAGDFDALAGTYLDSEAPPPR